MFNGEALTTNRNYAAPMLVVGCVLFGLGSLIVKFVPVGGYAIAFWRLLIASFIFYGLMKWKKQAFPKNRKRADGDCGAERERTCHFYFT